MFKIKEAQKVIHAISKAKGWYKLRDLSVKEVHARFKREIGMATNDVLAGLPPLFKTDPSGKSHKVGSAKYKTLVANPDGEAAQLAGLMIHILDYAEYRGLPIAKAFDDKLAFFKQLPNAAKKRNV